VGGHYLTSVEIFDQTTGEITKTVDTVDTGRHVFTTNGSGIYANDVGIYGDIDFFGSTTYQLLDPVADGKKGPVWNPNIHMITTAFNQESPNALFLGLDMNAEPLKTGYRAFTYDVVTHSFSPKYDVSTPLG